MSLLREAENENEILKFIRGWRKVSSHAFPHSCCFLVFVSREADRKSLSIYRHRIPTPRQRSTKAINFYFSLLFFFSSPAICTTAAKEQWEAEKQHLVRYMRGGVVGDGERLSNLSIISSLPAWVSLFKLNVIHKWNSDLYDERKVLLRISPSVIFRQKLFVQCEQGKEKRERERVEGKEKHSRTRKFPLPSTHHSKYAKLFLIWIRDLKESA